MRIGLHISTQGDPIKALSAFESAGGQAAQIFPGNPRRFDPSKQVPKYGGNMPIVVHSSYVVNLGHPGTYLKAIHGARRQYQWAQKIGAAFFVLHAGSSKELSHQDGIDSWKGALDVLLSYRTGDTRIAIENMAQGRPLGTKGSLGRLETVIQIVEGYSPEEVSICLDTAHAWGAAENLRALSRWHPSKWIRLVHANIPNQGITYGSRLDRHDQHILEGAFPIGLLTDVLQALKPDVAILESMVHTVQDCQYLYDLVMHSNENPHLFPGMNPAMLYSPEGAEEGA